jgi:hypothetical protein
MSSSSSLSSGFPHTGLPERWACCCCPLDPIPEELHAEFCGGVLHGRTIMLAHQPTEHPHEQQRWIGAIPSDSPCWPGQQLTLVCGPPYCCYSFMGVYAAARCCEPLDLIFERADICTDVQIVIHVYE